MHAYRIVWEDEAKAREIELFVDYTIESGVVSVEGIRPSSITFYNSESKKADRTIPVYTSTGRRMVVDAYLASREGQSSLEDEILAQHQLRDEEFATEAAR